MDFEIVPTNKLGGKWKQELAVVRGKVVYLRIAGDGTNYSVMTATAGEDVGGYRVCGDMERVWTAAVELAHSKNCEPNASKDRQGRDYIELFMMSQEESDSDEVFTKSFTDLLEEYFCVFDSLVSNGKGATVRASV